MLEIWRDTPVEVQRLESDDDTTSAQTYSRPVCLIESAAFYPDSKQQEK